MNCSLSVSPALFDGNDRHAFAFNLATTLMVAIIIFKVGDGTHSVTPITEFDGGAEVVAEIDPSPPDGGSLSRGVTPRL